MSGLSNLVVNVLDTWMEELVNIISIPLPTKKQVVPKSSSVADHLLFCNYSASYDDFSILTRENKRFLLELKESLLIMRDKLSLNRSIISAPLYLFDSLSNKIFVRNFFFLIVAALFLLNGLFIICHVSGYEHHCSR